VTDAEKVAESERWADLGLRVQALVDELVERGWEVAETWSRQAGEVTIVVRPRSPRTDG